VQSEVVGMAEQSRGRRRSAVVATTAAALGATLVGIAGATEAAHAAPAPTCSVQFTSSDENPVVGHNITLSWKTSGADELVASWTTAHVPFTGTQVTTKNTPGPASYQVTGLKSGQYCGGGVVNVVFAAAGASASTSAAAPRTSSSALSASTAATPSSTVAPTPTTSPSATFPAQSPTGGSSTPWYEQPVDLLVLGLLCLAGSGALFNRERVRAFLVRRH
jgi:hypothetical protein